MRLTLLTLLLVAVLSVAAMAVPNLQLYVPGGTYDNSTDTWVAPSSGSFDVWVLAGNLSPTDIIYDVTLVATIGSADPTSGSLTITPDGGAGTTYTGADFVWGTPPASDPLPPHGWFPAWYVTQLATSETSTNPADYVDVYDMPTMGGPTDGQIFEFAINSTYELVHFDAYGFQTKRNGDEKRIFAPFSHDAESGNGKTPPVPEPATMLLFGAGLAGAGIVRKLRK